MDGFFEKIEMFFKELLADVIITSMNGLVADLNDKVGTLGQEVALGPSDWNSSVFSLIKNLSDNVILPIGGLILTYVVCYEMYNMAVEQNNMKDFHISDYLKFLIKSSIAVYILSNTFTIVMAIFDLGSHAINQAIGEVTSNLTVSMGSFDAMRNKLLQMKIGALIGLVAEASLIKMLVFIVSIVISVILYGRMLEIYLYLSVAPIPFASFGNKDLSSIGQNYAKGLFSLAFQGFFIIVVLGMYGALVQSLTIGQDIREAMFSVAISTLVLLFALLKSGSISKSIFGAH